MGELRLWSYTIRGRYSKLYSANRPAGLWPVGQFLSFHAARKFFFDFFSAESGFARKKPVPLNALLAERESTTAIPKRKGVRRWKPTPAIMANSVGLTPFVRPYWSMWSWPCVYAWFLCPRRDSPGAFRIGIFSHHLYVILYFRDGYKNETSIYILVVFNFMLHDWRMVQTAV